MLVTSSLSLRSKSQTPLDLSGDIVVTNMGVFSYNGNSGINILCIWKDLVKFISSNVLSSGSDFLMLPQKRTKAQCTKVDADPVVYRLSGPEEEEILSARIATITIKSTTGNPSVSQVS